MSQKKTVIERRKHARISLCIKYSLMIDGEYYAGETGNISLGGAYLETIDPPLPQERLSQAGEITLTLEQERMTVACLVVFIGGGVIQHPTGIGITFHEISDENTNKLREFITQCL